MIRHDPDPHARPHRRSAWRRLGAALLTCGLAVVVGALVLHRHAAAPRPTAHVVRSRDLVVYDQWGLTGSGQINPAIQSQVDRETGGTLTTIHFYSSALHREADYLVFLPAGYSPSHPLPVFYLLHGMPGTPMGFTLNSNIEVRLEQLIHSHQVNPMILVFPDGRINGQEQSDSEWANTPSGDYQSYVLNVLANVDSRFAALPCRQERAIAGLSAGAFGAANVGLHEEPLFSLIQVWSGYFTETHNGVFAHADRQTMAYNSPIDYVRTMRQTLQQYPLRIFLYGGRSDPFTKQLPGMVSALKQEGADESWAIYPGGHSWKTWSPHVPQMLIMASNDFAHPLSGAVCS